MNAGFVNAFLKRYPWIHVVFDCFHIAKNSMIKIISIVRKDGTRRLKEVGNEQAALTLKRSRDTLTSSRTTLTTKDKLDRQSIILKICRTTKNEHFEWFGHLIETH